MLRDSFYKFPAIHSRYELGVVRRLTEYGRITQSAPPYSDEAFLAAQDESWKTLTRSRERDECRSKLVDLGLVAGE